MKIYATTIRPFFRAEGNVRGRDKKRTTPAAAIKDAAQDAESCASLGGGAYSDMVPKCVCGGTPYTIDIDACPASDRSSFLAAISEEIAQGNGIRRNRLQCDDWSGWIYCSAGVWRAKVRWPDEKEKHEVDADFSLIVGFR
jgi:hypothetical protein